VKIAITILALLSSQVAFTQASFVDVTVEKGFLGFEPAFEYGCGVAAADYDEDGHIDLYVLSDAQSPNYLYHNNGDGTFTIVENGLSVNMLSRAALWFDFNGDHLLDLFVAGDCFDGIGSCKDEDNLMLFKQLPNGSFEDVTSLSGLLTGKDFMGAFGGVATGDINNDGYLDLIIVMWEGDLTLYLNNGDGTFSDISTSSGIWNPARYWQPLIFDLNQNGWADIYLTVDSFENVFWSNNQDNTFEEIGALVNLNNDWDCMGIGIGDFDNDDDMDIYISNIQSNTKHNVLLQNNGEITEMYFEDIAIDAGVDQGGWGWGVTFIEANNDGFLDLAATNGWSASPGGDQSKLWKNIGDGIFIDISDNSGFNNSLEATTLISFDYDRDGDLDMVQTLKMDQFGGMRLLENQLNVSENFPNYLVIKPRMMGSNHWGIGSVVKIRIGTDIQTRPITAGISYYGQEPAEAFFGLGDAYTVDEVTIVWPGGTETGVSAILANQVVTITDANVLHAPGNVLASQSENLSIILSWGHMSTNETEFVIERSLDLNFSKVVNFSIDNSSKTFTDIELDPFTAYYYRIKASNGEINSKASNIVSVTTDSGEVIDAPTDLTGVVNSETSITLKWTDNADNEIGYTVQRSLFNTFNKFVEYDLTDNTSMFRNSNIEPNTTYYYRVRAYGTGSHSAFGNTVNLTTNVLLGLETDDYEVIVYPNPTDGTFRIKFPYDFQGGLEVNLMNETGQNILKWKFQNQSEASQHIFPVLLPVGMYFLLIKSSERVTVHNLLLD